MNAEQINILFVVAAIMILCYTVKGASDGFVVTVFEMFSVLVAAVAASILAPYVNSMLKKDIPLMAFLIAYLVLWLALKYVCAALDLISKLPIINELNKAAGILAGLFRGIFMVWILFIVITVFRFTEWGAAALEMVKANRILGELYQSNLILKLAEAFF